MKNLILKSLAITLILLVFPLKQHGQNPSFAHQDTTIDFDITDIALFDERVFFLYNLVNDSRFDVINSEKDGVFIISADEAYPSLDLHQAFEDFKNDNAKAFAAMEKEDASETAKAYKALLPNEFTLSLMMDIYARSRQNNLCANADPFCTDIGVYQYPAGVNAGSGESGPNYACLTTTPNPAWYYMKIENPGSINIYMYSTPSEDIDFCCWGPFEDPITPCPQGLTIQKKVSCSYSSNPTENCVIPSTAQTGDYFILVITNFSNHNCNITFSKTGGTGTTDCSIMPPLVENSGPYCVGETITLTGNAQGGATYSWSGPGNWTASGQNVTRPNCTLNMAGTYTCTITLNGQTSSADTEVDVYATSTANFTATTVCQGNPTHFSSTSTTNPSGQAITGYNWLFGDGQIGSGQNVDHTYTQPGTYQAKLTVHTGGDCQSEITKTVTVNPLPIPSFDFTTVCKGEATTFTNTSTGASVTNCQWNFGDGQTSTGESTTHVYEEPGTYEVTLTVQTDHGCSDEITQNVTVNPLPSANFTATTVCQGDTTVFANTSLGISITGCQWDFGDGNTASGENITHVYDEPGTYEVTLTVSNSYNCSDAITKNVTVNPQPTADFIADTVCNGQPTMFSNTSTGTSIISYQWDFGDGQTDSVENTTHIYEEPGIYEVTLFIENSSNCSNAITKSILVNPQPTADFTADTVCLGNATAFTSTSTGGTITSYHWEFGDGNNGTGENVTHVYEEPGIHEVTLTVTTTEGPCTDQITKTIIVNPQPTASFNATTECHGTPTEFTSTAIGGPITNYLWDFGDGNTGTGENVTHSYDQPGTYEVTHTVETAEGACVDMITQSVIVNSIPTPNFVFTTECQGNPTVFTNTSTGTPITGYEWNFGDGQTNSDPNPSHIYEQAGTYQVKLTVTGSNGACSEELTQTVTVHAQPVANAGNDQTISYGATTLLSGSGGTGTFNYHWEPANKVQNPDAQNTQTLGLTGQQTFTLTVTNPLGNCVDHDEMTVYIEGSNMTISPDATPTAICLGTSSQLDANAGGGTGNFTYLWSPSTGLNDPTIANPTASPNTTTTYTCTVNDGYSTASTSVTVTVNYPETSEETHYSCPSEPFIWHGQAYHNAGDFEFDTLTEHGCNKTITLHLYHYESYDENTIEDAICGGESFDFFGTPITESCYQLPHTLQTIHGCDSIIRLNLTVYPENETTVKRVTVCPEQLPYTFYDEEYYNEVDVTHTDHDIHGCDSLVQLILSISNYYIPDTEHKYICYDDTPSFTWDIHEPWWDPETHVYTEEGYYVDTVSTNTCDGIFSLDLHFKKAPDPIITIDTACDSYVWTVLGMDHQYHIPTNSQGHLFADTVRDNLAPYHYADGSPAYQEYFLSLQMYKTSEHEGDLLVENECDYYTWQFGHNGETETYSVNGNWTKTIPSKSSRHHCDSIVTLTIRNMQYTPNPYDSIFPTEPSTKMSKYYDTAYVITNTEFFSFIYDFYVNEKGPSKWDGCIWEKSPWADWDIIPYTPQGETLNKCCKVYVGQRYEQPVELTCKIWNHCMPEGDTLVRKLYLKSSFLDVDEHHPEYNCNVEIIPNPTEGQMQLNFDNMEGRVHIKVYDMTGRLIDGFETHIPSLNYNFEYHLDHQQDGIYYFIISNNRKTISRKVVLIH